MKDTITAAIKEFIEAAQNKDTAAFLVFFNKILGAILEYVGGEI